MNLGELKKIDLRVAWQHEQYDFSQWLSNEENLELLSKEIGIEISEVRTEASAGRYSVDIVAEEEGTGRKIVIENQLEATNHDHLGKIITYSAGLDAEIIIWLVRDYQEEHKLAVDWLNENTNTRINFFLVRIELWQIEDSPYAVKFNIISQPNDWAKALKETQREGQLTDTKLKQLDFWNRFNQFAESNYSKLRLRKAQPHHWYTISFGSPVSNLSLSVNSQSKQVGCELYIPDSKSYYEYLFSNKDNIETEMGYQLTWMELPEKKASRVKIFKTADWESENSWEEIFDWMKIQAEKFQKVFSKYKFTQG